MAERQIINDAIIWPHLHRDVNRFADVLAWLRANDIDPATVVADRTLAIETAPDGQQTIRYSVYLLNEHGAKYMEPATKGTIRDAPRAAMEERTIAMTVPLPARWQSSPEQLLNAAYRERAHLVAWLAAKYSSVIAPAPDVDEPGWQIVYVTFGGKQGSWHISPADADLFTRVPHVPADDPRAQWDGHTTDQKYARIRSHTRALWLATEENADA